MRIAARMKGKNMGQLKVILAAAALFLMTSAGRSETLEEKGLAIAREVDARNRGWVDSSVDLRMVLENQQREKSERRLWLRALEIISATDGDKSLTYFVAPADIQGTSLLSFAKLTGADDQWLYLPALKRVKRIASSNKSGAFVGSEFSYEDFLAQEVERFTYRFLREEPCPVAEARQLTCFVSERVPTYENSGYSKQIGWVDTKEYRPWRLDFFDVKGDQFKRLELGAYKQYGKFWRAHDLRMVNVANGKRTTLLFGEYKLNNGLDKSVFDPDALPRLR